MAKKVAVLVVNPVNGAGLFQYLEAFYENGIAYKTYAVAETIHVKTNSGIALQTDDVVAHLKGHEEEYDALVFACGDAIPTYMENTDKPYNLDMLAVIKTFDEKGKILVGHCGGGWLFGMAGAGAGKQVALHPYVKPYVQGCIGTDAKVMVDGHLFTAQDENNVAALVPELLKALA